MEIIIALITLAGVGLTATGGVIVAIINVKAKALEVSTKNNEKTLEAIKEVKKEVMGGIDELKKELAANNRATVATTRGLVSNAYWQYKDKKAIPEQVMHNIMDLYEAYKGVTIDGHVPNSWCDALIEEMKTWEII